MYQYKCKIIEIIDGDTVKVDIDVGFNIWMNNMVVRLLGVDSPESRTSDPIEKSFGILSKKRYRKHNIKIRHNNNFWFHIEHFVYLFPNL